MMKNFFSICLTLVVLMSSCTKNQIEDNFSEQDFLKKTSEEAKKFSLSNKNFALNAFVNGTWQGNCSNKNSEKVVIDFQDTGRVKVTFYSSDIDFGSGYEQGLYEIIDEKTIKLTYLAIGESISINKIDNNKIKLEGNGNSIIYGCNFERVK